MKKKRGLLVLLLLAAAALAGIWYFKFRGAGSTSSEDGAVFVSPVASITGTGISGTSTRFSGVVEPQKTVDVNVASGMKVDETYVTVGQEVDVGTKLFSYDTEEAQDSITQLEIDIEDADITVETTQAQIAEYEKERAKVSDDEKLAYTTQIMTLQNSIKRTEYNKKTKQSELESLKKQIANAVVTSEIKGVVKSINANNSGNTDESTSGGTDDTTSTAYIVLMATGQYRIKGTVNEQNMSQLQEGVSVIAHSRVDESITWTGTVSSIDRDNSTQSSSSSYYYGSDTSQTTSSSYPFYVDLDDSTGLMLGQHVYVEVDNGQSEERSGLWLDDYYLITDENGEVTPYVWAANDKDRLEKREVTLGEYDPDMMQYEITAGLETTDYIAFPDESCVEGAAVTRNVDQSGSYSDDGYDDSLSVDDEGNYDDSLLADDGADYSDDSSIVSGGVSDGVIYDADDESIGVIGGGSGVVVIEE